MRGRDYRADMSDRPLDPLPLALGQDSLDRRADLRRAGWEALPPTRRLVLLSTEGEVAVHRDEDRSAVLATPGATEAASTSTDLFLGLDEQGAAVCGRVVPVESGDLPEGAQWAGLRSVGMRLPVADRGIVVELLALANWHRTHVRCPRCGTRTEVAGLGWWRTCPQDGSEHYPRTDPAVIALLVDAEGNALLGRQTIWPEGAFSTLAGFVEPGESAEAAVLREFGEEVALRPSAITYAGSQPWPFPGSLMLGFRASIDAVRPEPTVDGEEIAEARWLSRAELPAAAEDRLVRLPGRLSIAHHLIRNWFGADLPDVWCRW